MRILSLAAFFALKFLFHYFLFGASQYIAEYFRCRHRFHHATLMGAAQQPVATTALDYTFETADRRLEKQTHHGWD